MAQTTSNTKFIKATADTIYRAFTNPKAMERWLAPENMTGKIHRFDWREGGGYEMSLFYPGDENETQGKTAAKEDRFTAKLVKIKPAKEIIQAINFESSDQQFAGEMICEILLDEVPGGTVITFLFKNIPVGIRPEDNEEGTAMTLDKLARYVERPVNRENEIDEQCSDGSANAFEDK